jgi:hypothetical protein
LNDPFELSEGKGMITAGNGINGNYTIGWTSHDIGKINFDRSVNYHGIMFFLGSNNNTSSIRKLGFLSNTAACIQPLLMLMEAR